MALQVAVNAVDQHSITCGANEKHVYITHSLKTGMSSNAFFSNVKSHHTQLNGP